MNSTWTARQVTAVVLVLLAAGSAGAATSAWPGSSTGTSLAGNLPSGFEPSGIVWDPASGKLYLVSDTGVLTQMTTGGTVNHNWSYPYPPPNPLPPNWPFTGKTDFESVTVTGTGGLVYVGLEVPPTIYEFNPSAGAFTGKSWALTDLPSNSTDGMEGLAFVPNGYSPYPSSTSGGLFYASSQTDGSIHVYDVPLSGTGAQSVTSIASFTPDASNKDVADLYFSTGTRILYVLYGNAKKIIQVAGDTSQNGTTYAVPPNTDTGLEGITLIGTCPTNGTATIDLANDHGPVTAYTGYPQPCATRLTDSGDATISEQNPTQTYGSATTLVSDGSPKEEILIQFTGLPSTVKTAKLQLYVTDGTDKSPNICYLTSAWNEATVTWNTRPQCGGSGQGGGATVSNNTWVTYDVTSLVQAGHLSFGLYAGSTNDMVARSKEAGTATPVLIVTTQP